MEKGVIIILDLLAMHKQDELLIPVRKNLTLLIKRLRGYQYKVEKSNKDNTTYYFNGLIDTIAYIAKFKN